MVKSKPQSIVLLALAAVLVWLGGFGVSPQAVSNPGQPGPCSVTTQTVTIGGSLETQVYLPAGAQCSGGLAAPYPGVVFAHGFSMFGLSNGASENAGNAEHLASWGMVVTLPRLPDEAEDRTDGVQRVLAYLEAQTRTAGSFLYGKVDANRLAVAGYSLGGASVLSTAARDRRVRAVVALDPVYHTGGFGQTGDPIWDLQAEGPRIAVPTLILGAPPSSCNSDADYAEIYPKLGATHKAEFLIKGASHCDFADPGGLFCSFLCGATDQNRTRLSQKYMVAWFNYYLHCDASYYEYLFGAEAERDIDQGAVQRRVDTAPRSVQATGQERSVLLAWNAYNHPMVAGYHAYRRNASSAYPAVPQISTGKVGSYLDSNLAGGQTYSYVLCSHDPAGQEHQLLPEITARTGGAAPPPNLEERLYLPLQLR